jgi:TonB family protein
LGALFRSKQIPADSNTEMVIILTPTVLTDKKIANTQLVMPTPEVRRGYHEFESKYEQEPINSTWPQAKEPLATIEEAKEPPAAHKDSAEELTDYARMVQRKISKVISYPQNLSGGGIVKLKLRILKDGSLDSEEVVESSGNDVLDQDAIQAAKSAAPYDVFTTGMDQQDIIFTVPIVYNKVIAAH